MTAQLAAIKASFSDYRRIKGRKVGQLVFEVPLETFQAAIAALGGEPAAVEERWVAIALLNPEIVNPPARRGTPAEPDDGSKSSPDRSAGGVKERRSFDELPASQQAAMLCNEPRFARFLKEEYRDLMEIAHDDTPSVVRHICLVESRSQIGGPETASGRLWRELYAEYQAWKSL